MIRNRYNIFWVDAGIHTKNGGKTYASCAWRMMQFSLRFWSGYLHQPKKYYNDSLIPGIRQVFHVIPEIFWTFYAYFLTESL